MKRAVRLLALAWWHLAAQLDKIPGFNEAIEGIYTDEVEQERKGTS